MSAPLPEPVPQKEFSEAEFVRILRTAAELHDRSTGAFTSQKLTLAEIEQIAGEVGIAPEHIATAALLVATEAGERWNVWLAAPVKGQLSRAVPGAIPDHAWQEIAAVIRQTMGHAGQHSYVPGALEWVHSDAGSQVRVEVSAAHDRTHVQISADHREAAALYLTVGPVLGASLAVIPIAVFGWAEVVEAWLLLSGGAGAGLTVGWASLKAVSARWQRRLRGVLQALAERAASAGVDSRG